jgi:hypothetical protein
LSKQTPSLSLFLPISGPGLRLLKWPGIGKNFQLLTKRWDKFSQTPKILGFGKLSSFLEKLLAGVKRNFAFCFVFFPKLEEFFIGRISWLIFTPSKFYLGIFLPI